MSAWVEEGEREKGEENTEDEREEEREDERLRLVCRLYILS